jgi:hypothetical protein
MNDLILSYLNSLCLSIARSDSVPPIYGQYMVRLRHNGKAERLNFHKLVCDPAVPPNVRADS